MFGSRICPGPRAVGYDPRGGQGTYRSGQTWVEPAVANEITTKNASAVEPARACRPDHERDNLSGTQGYAEVAWLPAYDRLLRRVAGTARDDPNVGTGNQKRAQRSRADSWEREANDVWPRSGRCEQTPDRLDPTFPHACSTPREGRRAVVTNSCALHPCTQCRGCRAIHSFFTRHDGLLRGTCHRARIRAARRLAMAMAEKLPRRRSSLIFSIHPFPGVSRTKDGGLGVAQRKRRVSICLFPAWRSGEAREPASLQ